MPYYEDAIKSQAELLVDNINKINSAIVDVNSNEIANMLVKLRLVEKKMALVFTFFKASGYANDRDNSAVYEEGFTNRPQI